MSFGKRNQTLVIANVATTRSALIRMPNESQTHHLCLAHNKKSFAFMHKTHSYSRVANSQYATSADVSQLFYTVEDNLDETTS